MALSWLVTQLQFKCVVVVVLVSLFAGLIVFVVVVVLLLPQLCQYCSPLVWRQLPGLGPHSPTRASSSTNAQGSCAKDRNGDGEAG